MAKLETKIESDFATFVHKSTDCKCIKLLPSLLGIPDRMVIGPSRLIFFIEFKRPGEGPKRIQLHIHNLLRSYGFNVYVCTSVEEAKKALTEEQVLNNY